MNDPTLPPNGPAADPAELPTLAPADPAAAATLPPSPDGSGPTDGTPAPSAGAGRYHVLRPLARGGLGEVFLAHDEELDREVALKEIQAPFADDPASRTRFVREGKVTGGLEHPGIVPVYGLGVRSDGRPYYAMRFIKGQSLRDAITAFHKADVPGRDPGERSLAQHQLLRRFIDVCNAIAYAHSRGVVHRDLKPDNVMLGSFGETLVVDWGLARAFGQADEAADAAEARPAAPASPAGSNQAVTQAGAVIGTPAYMSPEQAGGKGAELGPAADVYSLGATLYCLLTGKAPIEEPDVLLTLVRVQFGEFPPPRQVNRRVPAALEAVCLKAMALRPRDRYASARDLANDLEHWLADEPVVAHREGPWERVRRLSRRRPLFTAWLSFILAIDLATAVAVGGMWVFSNPQVRAAAAFLPFVVFGAALGIGFLLLLVTQLGWLVGAVLGTLVGAALATSRRKFPGNAGRVAVGALLGLLLGVTLVFLVLAAGASQTALVHLVIAVLAALLVGGPPGAALGALLACRRGARKRVIGGALLGGRLGIAGAALACILLMAWFGGQTYLALRPDSVLPLLVPPLLGAAPPLVAVLHGLLTRARWDRLLTRFTRGSVAGALLGGVAALVTLMVSRPQFVPPAAGAPPAAPQPAVRPALTDPTQTLVANLEKQLRDNPKNVESAVTLGNLYKGQARAARAAKDPQKALLLYDKVIATLRPALDHEPRNSRAREALRDGHAGRAETLALLNRPKDELAEWDLALGLDTWTSGQEMRLQRALALARLGQHAEAAKECDALAGGKNLPGPTLFTLAQAYASAAGAVRSGPALPPADQEALRERYAGRATALLGEAEAAGYFKAPGPLNDLRTSPDFKALGTREDFKGFVARLAKPR
jgi:serine/threonine protein kinase/tetratricopeptide (TPR) repeat protein